MLINVNEGIATGDMVRVFSDMGEILVGALVTDIIPDTSSPSAKVHVTTLKC